MTKLTNKLKQYDRFIDKYGAFIAVIFYLLMCVYAFWGTTVTIADVEIQQPEAGFYGLLVMHAIIGIAVVGALIIHWITKLIARVFK